MRGLPAALAAWALLSAARGASAQPHALEAQAQERYQQGRQRYHAGDFSGALEEFRASLDLVASPNTRMYMGRALRRLGRLAEAYVALDRASRDAAERAEGEPRYSATRDVARAEADALAPRIARVAVDVSPPDGDFVVRVNGHEVPRAGWGVAMPVDPGAVAAVASGAGYLPGRAEAVVSAGESVRLTVTLERAPSPPEPPGPLVVTDPPAVVTVLRPRPLTATVDRGRGWRTAGLVTGAIGLVGGLAACGVLGALVLDTRSTLEGLGEGEDTFATRDALSREGERYTLGFNVALGVGLGLVATGAVLYLWPGSAREREPSALRVGYDPARGTVLLGGAF